jgi:hypothetical protein
MWKDHVCRFQHAAATVLKSTQLIARLVDTETTYCDVNLMSWMLIPTYQIVNTQSILRATTTWRVSFPSVHR